MRSATVERITKETQIRGTIRIEGKGRYDVHTGVRFLDHMLELFTKHGGFDLDLTRPGTSMSINITPSKTSASLWDNCSRKRLAIGKESTAPATMSCPWTRHLP